MDTKVYQYNKGVNKKTKFLGVTLQELMFLMVGLIGLMLIAAILNTFGIEHWSIYLIVFALSFAGLFGLKYANKQDHPTFIFSFIGFKMLQTRKIHHLMPGSYEKQMEATRKELARFKKRKIKNKN